jgi:hypothetical protein
LLLCQVILTAFFHSIQHSNQRAGSKRVISAVTGRAKTRRKKLDEYRGTASNLLLRVILVRVVPRVCANKFPTCNQATQGVGGIARTARAIARMVAALSGTSTDQSKFDCAWA